MVWRGQSHPEEQGSNIFQCCLGSRCASRQCSDIYFFYMKTDIETGSVLICCSGLLLIFALNVQRGTLPEKNLSHNKELHLEVVPDLSLKANLTTGALSQIIKKHTLSGNLETSSFLCFANTHVTYNGWF